MSASFLPQIWTGKLLDEMNRVSPISSWMRGVAPVDNSPRGRLLARLDDSVGFDHIEAAIVRGIAVVFVVKNGQTQVLQDKAKRFPSKQLIAKLVLMGS